MRVWIPLLLMALAGAPVPEKGSPALVGQLVTAMSARQLDAIAVPDRYEPGRFIAALVFPDVQMLVISARAGSADALLKQIAERRYRDAYRDLHLGVAEGRVFIHDMGCNGIQEDGDDADIFYEGADRRTIFDGNWTAQALTEDQYLAKQTEADDRYSRALALLLDGVRRIPLDRR